MLVSYKQVSYKKTCTIAIVQLVIELTALVVECQRKIVIVDSNLESYWRILLITR